MPSRKKAKVTSASAVLPRKNCAAKYRKFVVWFCTIRRGSRLSRTNEIRAFWRKPGNSIAASAGVWTRFPRPKSLEAPKRQDQEKPPRRQAVARLNQGIETPNRFDSQTKLGSNGAIVPGELGSRDRLSESELTEAGPWRGSPCFRTSRVYSIRPM